MYVMISCVSRFVDLLVPQLLAFEKWFAHYYFFFFSINPVIESANADPSLTKNAPLPR
jgi:hypothetical protein